MIKGKSKVDFNNAYEGKACVRIVNGEVAQRLNANPFSIIEWHAYAKLSDSSVAAHAFLGFYDASNKLLLEYTNVLNRTITYQQTGFYTEAPFHTKYIRIGIRKDAGFPGDVYADAFKCNTHVAPIAKHKPIGNMDEYMKPFWNTDTIYNETVLLYSEGGKEANGKLLFTPDKILSVKDFGLGRNFEADKDYTIQDNQIIRTEKSAMPFRADTSFDTKNNLSWFNIQSQWVNVTYTHHDRWSGPLPVYKGDKMTKTMAKLNNKQSIRVIAYGMSITRGMDASGYDTVPPYMPPYIDLFCGQLKKIFKSDNIKIFNAGLPGASVEWAAEYADQYINPVKPDLVVIDFGMNDFWRITPEQFKGYIDTIIKKVKKKNPDAEFLLISGMRFDPAYVLNADPNRSFYENNLTGYNAVLQSLEGEGIIDLDMTTLSGYIYQHKKAKDCVANPLHPNDYLSRWFAQEMVALFNDNPSP